MTEQNESAVEEPEFSEARIAEMKDLNSRAGLVDEDGSAP